jgi:predicted nuclease of predicted toxin-antitoxin system
MKFLIDAQRPPGLAAWLRQMGHEADHLMAVAGLNAPDAMIWDLAIAEDDVIITKDHDFVGWARSKTPKPRIL